MVQGLPPASVSKAKGGLLEAALPAWSREHSVHPAERAAPGPGLAGVPHLLIAQACRPLGNFHSLSPAVVDHYTSKIVFNSVRVIAIIIIGLGFLLLLLPEEWDVWLIKLLTRLKVRKKEEAAEGGADLGLGLQSKSRRARPSFAR